jgi:signal transduction histidine kinase
VIEALRVDGQTVAKASRHGVRIAPGWHTLEFDYTALSFVAPSKVQFKYRLAGLSEVWVDAGNRRSANYTYVPPGSYRFEVTACNEAGVWAKTPGVLAFELLPSFYQTIWFKTSAAVLIVAAAGSLAWLEARRRSRNKLRDLTQAQAIATERSRIARDIHDDFGSRLTHISMLSHNAIVNQKDVHKLDANLGEIRRSASELTQVIGEVVWAVAPHHDSLRSLITYAERFAHSFLQRAEIRCRIDIPADIPDLVLTPETRHNTFLAFKEAVNNAVRHAHASEVKLTVRLDDKTCQIIVVDNGSGETRPMTPPETSGGNGLRNMRTRMAEIGGTCEIVGGEPKGTRVVLEIPLAPKWNHTFD